MEKIFEKNNERINSLKEQIESISKENNKILKNNKIEIAKNDLMIMQKDFEILRLTQKTITNNIEALLAVSNVLISVIEKSEIDFDLSDAKDIVKQTKEYQEIIKNALND